MNHLLLINYYLITCRLASLPLDFIPPTTGIFYFFFKKNLKCDIEKIIIIFAWNIDIYLLSCYNLQIVLVAGTKMEVIVAKMALKLKYNNNITKGTPLVQPNDDFFWFGHPKHILTLIHFTLVMVPTLHFFLFLIVRVIKLWDSYI